MCEVMLDIQMIVPTGRPMGDGGGSESSLFQNLYIRVGKDKHTQSGWLREGPYTFDAFMNNLDVGIVFAEHKATDALA